MKDIIKVNITKEHIYDCKTRKIGRKGENISTSFEITLDEDLLNLDVYIEFLKPNGESLVTPKLDLIRNIATYDVPLYILDTAGNLKVQIVLRDIETGVIWKTFVKKYIIEEGICACEDIPNKEDWITEAQKLLDEGIKLKEEFETNIQPILEETTEKSNTALENSATALSIAKGRATGYVFDTLADLDLWLKDNSNKSKLVLGDNFYIKALDVPDYWWDGSNKQPLETQKVELGDYVKSSKDNNIVYCKYEHKDYGIEFSSSQAKPYTMVRRDSNGGVITATPKRNDEATNKEYVDKKFISKSNQFGTFYLGVLQIHDPDYQEFAEELYNTVVYWKDNNLGNNASFVLNSLLGTQKYIHSYEDFITVSKGIYLVSLGEI